MKSDAFIKALPTKVHEALKKVTYLGSDDWGESEEAAMNFNKNWTTINIEYWYSVEVGRNATTYEVINIVNKFDIAINEYSGLNNEGKQSNSTYYFSSPEDTIQSEFLCEPEHDLNNVCEVVLGGITIAIPTNNEHDIADSNRTQFDLIIAVNSVIREAMENNVFIQPSSSTTNNTLKKVKYLGTNLSSDNPVVQDPTYIKANDTFLYYVEVSSDSSDQEIAEILSRLDNATNKKIELYVKGQGLGFIHSSLPDDVINDSYNCSALQSHNSTCKVVSGGLNVVISSLSNFSSHDELDVTSNLLASMNNIIRNSMQDNHYVYPSPSAVDEKLVSTTYLGGDDLEPIEISFWYSVEVLNTATKNEVIDIVKAIDHAITNVVQSKHEVAEPTSGWLLSPLPADSIHHEFECEAVKNSTNICKVSSGGMLILAPLNDDTGLTVPSMVAPENISHIVHVYVSEAMISDNFVKPSKNFIDDKLQKVTYLGDSDLVSTDVKFWYTIEVYDNVTENDVVDILNKLDDAITVQVQTVVGDEEQGLRLQYSSSQGYYSGRLPM